MFKNEFKKSMHGMIAILLILIICYFIVLIFSGQNYNESMVQYYKEYMDILEGELDSEKDAYIREEYERVVVAMETNDELIAKGMDIDLEAMQYAMEHQDAFNMLYEKYNYISGLQNKNEQIFYYDLDWKDYFEKTGVNYFEIFALVILVLYSVTMEFHDGRDILIKTSYKGRIPYMSAKQNALIFAGAVLSFAFSVADFVYMLIFMEPYTLSFPVRSMTEFSGLSVSFSIVEYIILRALCHILWCMVTVLIMSTIGLLVKKFQTGIFIGLVSMIIPLSLKDMADDKYIIWIYSVHMDKDTAVCSYGLLGILTAMIMAVIFYLINLKLWCRIRKK